jgi:diguanylate cyclase
MPQQDEYRQRSHALSRETLALINELGLSANPVNFAVFYAYFEKSNDGLVLAIDILRSNKRDIDDLKCHELYQHFIEPDRASSNIRDNGEENLRTQISTVIAELTDGKTKISTQALKAAIAAILYGDVAKTHETPRLETFETKPESTDPAMPEVTQLLHDLEEMKRETLTDGLTGIANRKAFDECLRDAAMDTMEGGECLSMLMIDIDHFKRINDTFGHPTGDQVIRHIATTLQANVKGRDTTARYGGEEFAVVLPATNLDDALRVAENIRQSIAALQIKSEHRNQEIGAITASVGVANFKLGEPLSRVIERADQALYLAKASGRNQVRSERELLDWAADQQADCA